MYRGEYLNREKEGEHIVYYKKDEQTDDTRKYVKKYKDGEEEHLYSEYEDPMTEDELDEQTTTHYHENGSVKYERKGTVRLCYYGDGSINYKHDIPKENGKLVKQESYHKNGKIRSKSTYIKSNNTRWIQSIQYETYESYSEEGALQTKMYYPKDEGFKKILEEKETILERYRE